MVPLATVPDRMLRACPAVIQPGLREELASSVRLVTADMITPNPLIATAVEGHLATRTLTGHGRKTLSQSVSDTPNTSPVSA